MYRLNSNDDGGAGYPGTKTWIAAEGVPFSSYDVYAYQLKLTTDNYAGDDSDWEWVKLNTTPLAGDFALEWDKKSGQRCLAAVQVLSLDAGGTATAPVITAIHSGGSDVVLEWTATNSGSYSVEFTPSLLPAAWTNVPGMGTITGSNGTVSVTDTNAAAPQKFYRVNGTF